jgi:predicted secreted protein
MSTILAYVAIYFVVWFICLFAVLPWGAHNQSDEGVHVHGTERGAPVVFRMWKKLLANSLLAAVVVALLGWGVSNPAIQRYWH